jgi:hypothetical protein
MLAEIYTLETNIIFENNTRIRISAGSNIDHCRKLKALLNVRK